jgi:hypothetical protein
MPPMVCPKLAPQANNMQQNKYVHQLKITSTKIDIDMSSNIKRSHSIGLVVAKDFMLNNINSQFSLHLQSNIESGMSQTTHLL